MSIILLLLSGKNTVNRLNCIGVSKHRVSVVDEFVGFVNRRRERAFVSVVVGSLVLIVDFVHLLQHSSVDLVLTQFSLLLLRRSEERTVNILLLLTLELLLLVLERLLVVLSILLRNELRLVLLVVVLVGIGEGGEDIFVSLEVEEYLLDLRRRSFVD